MMHERAPEQVVDVLVIGSGAGALVAALRAARAGAKVLVVEKGSLWGGTSATSGGGIWIPGSDAASSAGHPDDLDDAYTYIRALSDTNVPDAQIHAYVETARLMLRWVEAETTLRFMALPYPDYYPEVAGSREGYRTHLLPGSVDGKALSPNAFSTMQRASPAASLWGRINTNMEVTSTILVRGPGWLGKTVRMIGRYWLDIPQRLQGPRDRWLTMGTALLAGLRTAIDKEGVGVWLESPLVSLIEQDGAIRGALICRNGINTRVMARKAVILASGGFERNAALRQQHLPGAYAPEASGSQINNEGDGLIEAMRVGAAVRNLDAAWWAPVFRIPGEARSRLSTVERSLPHSIVVDQGGQRFVNEALSYHRFGEAMMARPEGAPVRDPSWLVFDSRYRRKYPAGPVLPGVPDMLLSKGAREALVSAPSIEVLAKRIGVPAERLSATVARFNVLAAAGKDDDFGRGDSAYDRLYGDPANLPNPTLGSIAHGPFYAIPIHLGDIGTSGGIVTDPCARVLREDGSIIPGLYAVGNVSASVMGHSYPGAGATLGPAMTFGWIAATDACGVNHIVEEPGES